MGTTRLLYEKARRRVAADDGFTLIEIMIATTMIVVGILGALVAFTTSDKLSLVSERHTAMTQIAQREIERIEGLRFSQVALTSAPSSSSDPTNPDYYVTGTSLQYDHSSAATEPLVLDATNGTVTPTQSWSETSQGGLLTGQIYDFVTWTTDAKCSPGCPSSQDYKRIVVAVTMGAGVHPNPVYVTSVVADPAAAPAGGVVNGSSGNPLINPATTCANSSGQPAPCTQDLGSGTPVTYYLHDFSSSGGTPAPPAADHALHDTVGLISGGTCTGSQSLATTSANTTGCPQPDVMDANPPSSPAQPATSSCATSTVYDYSNDLGTRICGRELVPTCQGTACPAGSQPGTACTTTSCGGTGASTDCSDGTWASTTQNQTSELWVSPALASNTTFTGAAGVSFYTQTLNSAASGLVSLCAEIYDVPPSGSASTLTDIFAWPPVALGGGSYIPASQGASNWPATVSQLSFVFRYSSSAVTVSAGHRIAVRVWFKENASTPIDVIYDNPAYPAQLQVNSQ